MDEYTLLIIGDLELMRRILLKQLRDANQRIIELEAQLAASETSGQHETIATDKG